VSRATLRLLINFKLLPTNHHAPRFARRAAFAQLMSDLELIFSSESSATLDEEGLQIATYAANCLNACGLVFDFFDAVFDASEPRAEWGGYDWTAQLLGPFCGLVQLTETAKDANGNLSEAGEIFVKNLFDLSKDIPIEYSNKCVAMWRPLMKVDESVNINKGVPDPNVHAIVSFLLYVTAKSGDHIHVCQQIAL